MRVFGSGKRTWNVTVVFRADGTPRGHEREAEIVEALNRQAHQVSAKPVGTLGRVRPANCWDMIPPDGAVGAELWVLADTVGQAAQEAFRVVEEECLRVIGRRLPLWDVRVVPREAIDVGEGDLGEGVVG